jgi:hypothetical protein
MHEASDNLKNLEFRFEIVARMIKTTRRQTLSPFSQNKVDRAIGRWYRQYFRIDCNDQTKRETTTPALARSSLGQVA